MLTEETRTADFAVIDRMVAAIEQADMKSLVECFTPDARFWHNVDEMAQDVDAVVAILGGLCNVSSRRYYEDRRSTYAGSVAFLQHILTAELQSGDTLRVPAMMRVDVTADGLIERIEEYYDSRATDVLFPPSA